MSVGKLTRYGLPYSNVVASGTATNVITAGRTLENLRLKLGGTALTKAMLSMIKVKAGNKTIIEGTGTHLDAINAYRSTIAQGAAFLDLAFADYSLNNELDRMVGAFDTSLVTNGITTEVTTTGATAPTITPILTESGSQKDRAGAMQPYAPLVSKILPYPFAIATGGKLPVTLPFGPQTGSIVKRVHVFHTGTMTGATVKQDGVVVHESVAAENSYDQQRQGRTPQANCYTLDFVVDGDVRKALDTRDAKSLEWLFDFSAASNGTIYVEYLDALGNL
jgi:hypothetical protein